VDEPATRDPPSVQAYARHVNPAFVKLLGVLGYGRLLTRARDVWVWDHAGREYLDCLAGFGSVNIGHNHPRLKARLQRFLDEDALMFVHVGPSAHAGELAARLAALAGPPLDVALLSSSGAEAVEAGMKLARAATGRPGFLSCEGGFHGTSLGVLSIMGAPRMRDPFEPLLASCARVPWGDLAALEKALRTKAFAAFVIDPFNCESVAGPPPAGYLAEAQRLCAKAGTILVLDEVQTGLGRTGTMFAYQAEGFVPDVLCLAKSLSGGIAPIGATLTSAALQERAYGTMERFDLHSSTFGGNAFSCVAALETLSILEDQALARASAERGADLLQRLRARLAAHPLVKEVRGRGLLVSIALGPTDQGWVNKLAPGLVRAVSRGAFGQWAAVRLLERGVIVQPATQSWDVIKLEPPLTLAPPEVERVVAQVGEVLDAYQGVSGVMNDVVSRVGKQFMAGWAF
jgi:putrescine aminotransferase